MSEKARWDPSTIPHLLTRDKRRPFKLGKVLIFVVRFRRKRMRVGTYQDAFNQLFTSFLVVCFQQIRMRMKTIQTHEFPCSSGRKQLRAENFFVKSAVVF